MSVDTRTYTGTLSRSVGARIRIIRKTTGLTLEQLARLCDTTPQTMQRLEVGNMTLSIDWVETIAKALCVEPVQLFDGPHRDLGDQIETMRTEAEVLKIRAADFIGRIDSFLKATE